MSKEFFIYGLYLGFLGLMLVLYLAYLIRKNNEALRNAYTQLNKDIIASYDKIFVRFEEYMNNYFENHKKELDTFNNMLRNEVDKYSEVMDKYRNSILSISGSSKDIVESNRQLSSQLSGVVFSDLKKINDSLREVNDSYTKFEERLNTNLSSLNEMMRGLSGMQQSFIAADSNFSRLELLNQNFSELINGIKESSVQMQMVANNVSALMETSLKPVVTEITALIPELRKETLSISTDLYEKFEELVKKLDGINERMQDITDAYRAILDGNKKDPVTRSFTS